MYKQKNRFTVPMKLLCPVWTESYGVRKKTYPTDGEVIYASFKTYGGTETQKDGLTVVEDTATVETWFRPDIRCECRILLETGEVYEVISEPENIERRNTFCKFKVRRYKGGA